MPLQETVIPISFTKGLDTKSDPKQIAAGSMLSLQNAVFTRPGEIIKRNGYTSLVKSIFPDRATSSGGISSGNSLGQLNDVMTLADNQYLYTYLPDLQSWSNNGVKTNTAISVDSLTGVSGSGFNASETSQLSGYKLSAYPISDNTQQVGVTISDYITNTPVANLVVTVATDVLYTTSLIYNGNFLLVIKGTGVTYLYTIETVSGTFAQTNVINLEEDASCQAIQILQDGVYLYMAYSDLSHNLVLAKYDNTYNIVTSTILLATTITTGLSLVLDAANAVLAIAYSTSSGLSVQVCDTATLTVQGVPYTSATTILGKVVLCVNSPDLFLGYELQSNDTVNYYMQGLVFPNYLTSLATPRTVPNIAYHTRLYSGAFTDGLGYYYVVSSTDPIQTGQYIIRVSTTFNGTNHPVDIAGKFGLEISNNLLYQGLVMWNGLMLPFLRSTHTTFIDGQIMGQYQLAEVTLSFDEKLTNVTLGENINYVGSITSIYDGEGIAEAGYNLFPSIVSLSGGGSGTEAYSYAAVYTWIDFQGNLHRSAPCTPNSPTGLAAIGPSNGVTVGITGLGLSEPYKAKNVIIQLYRTQSTGTVYYLVGEIENNTIGIVTIVDTTTDVNLSNNLQLYTSGGELENIGPPATNLMTSFKNRVILVDAENPLTWWFSKQIIQGFPAEYSDVLVQNIDQKAGNITALSTMDDKLVFFKESNIWYVIGDGPGPNGLNNDFSYPQIISSDTGCINQSSIVLSPSGLFFQSPKGIYLLGRDLSLNYIGSSVEQYTAANNVTSAQMIAGTNQIRFSLDNSIVLVYDYFVKQWSVFTNIAAVDTIIYKQNYTYLTMDGTVNEETPGSYFDPNATPISLSLTTGWFSFAGLQNFQRVKQFLLLGESESFTEMSVSMAYNFDSTIRQTDVVEFQNARVPRQERFFMQLQKCESIQITISDSPTTGSGEGLRLSAFAFNIAQKKGPFKLPASRTYG